MSIITYKGYTGKVEVDIESATLHGRILDINDVITYELPHPATRGWGF